MHIQVRYNTEAAIFFRIFWHFHLVFGTLYIFLDVLKGTLTGTLEKFRIDVPDIYTSHAYKLSSPFSFPGMIIKQADLVFFPRAKLSFPLVTFKIPDSRMFPASLYPTIKAR